MHQLLPIHSPSETLIPYIVPCHLAGLSLETQLNQPSKHNFHVLWSPRDSKEGDDAVLVLRGFEVYLGKHSSTNEIRSEKRGPGGLEYLKDCLKEAQLEWVLKEGLDKGQGTSTSRNKESRNRGAEMQVWCTRSSLLHLALPAPL